MKSTLNKVLLRSMEETLEFLHETPVKLQGSVDNNQFLSRVGVGSAALKERSCWESLKRPFTAAGEAGGRKKIRRRTKSGCR